MARRVLVQVLDERRLHGDVDAAMTELWASLTDGPLWPDVARGVSHLARAHRVGLLSNIDDALLARTRLASLSFVGFVITAAGMLALAASPVGMSAYRGSRLPRASLVGMGWFGPATRNASLQLVSRVVSDFTVGVRDNGVCLLLRRLCCVPVMSRS